MRTKWALGWVPVLALCAVAAADTIYMVDGLALSGKVKDVNDERVVVLLEGGLVGIPRARVKRIEYDIESRRAQVAQNDHKGRYDLAVFALGQGKKDVAAEELTLAAGKPGVPPDAWKLLATLKKAAGDNKTALVAITEYLKLMPDDKEAEAFRDELLKAVSPPKPTTDAGVPAVQSGPTGAAPGPAVGASSTSAPAPSVTASPAKPEGLEDGGWVVEGWGNPATVQVALSETNKVLAIIAGAGGSQDKTAVSLSKRMDLSGKKKLFFSAHVDGAQAVPAALAFITDDYYESRMLTLKPGWNLDMAVDVTTKDFKCRATNWAFQSALNNANRVSKIVFLVYNGKAAANIFLDDVRAE